jgi:glutamyl-tRNA synthetase
MNNIVTRFAPSPTGLLHMGNYRTAVFAYLYAKRHGGTFIVRIEDTDRERSKKEYEENILESLAWLNLKYDSFYRQSENLSRHTHFLQKLVDEGKAYISKEEAKDGSGTIRELVRFKNPNKKVTFVDAIRGEITTDTTDLGDFVIAKSITEPLFHMAVVVDDFEEGVTHVLRGEDHIPNTPRQMLIQEALGFPHPTYAHFPLVLAEDRTKLSKRKGAKPITWYRDEGYLPEALCNFMALIGWNPGGEKELFSLEELVSLFDFSQVSKGGAICNEEKLEWINKEHIKLQPREVQKMHLEKYLSGYGEDLFNRMQDLVIERITHYGQLRAIESTEFIFLKDRPTYEPSMLLWKDTEKQTLIKNLETVKEILSKASSWNKDSLKNDIFPYAEQVGKGEVLWPLRVALSGRDKSADPFTLLSILEKEESFARIDEACRLLHELQVDHTG